MYVPEPNGCGHSARISAVGDVARTLSPSVVGLVAQSVSLNPVFGAMAIFNMVNVTVLLVIREPEP